MHVAHGVLLAFAGLLTIPVYLQADQTVNLAATADSLVRELDASSNFGGAGLLCVAGMNSVNGAGSPRGRFDTVVKFNTASAITVFNSAYGSGGWTVTAVQLQLSQVAAPENTFFPRGAGQFSAAWQSSDSWSEGTGTPSAPQPGSGDVITWQLLQSLVTGGTERALGGFSVVPEDSGHTYSLILDAAFVADLKSGGDVTLHLLPQTADLGFTFHSHDFSDPAQQPLLIVTAAPLVYGDLNCDGAVNTTDIAPFVLALLDPAAYASAYPTCSSERGDLNHDGAIDGRDVQAFALALLGP